MQPFCFSEGSSTNFGDDLNRWLWSRLMPEQMESEDGTLFCGIGTVLGQGVGLPQMERYVVFSSGVGYGPPPDGFGSPAWTIVCVRGPLTARVLGLPASKAVTDGAILLSCLPELKPLPEAERTGTVFVPHHDVLELADWPEICRRAGVEFLSPRLPSEHVVERIRRAKLVLADAMHAAIVADTMRVPWVPVVTSNRINTFKWLDWALTLDLPYKPIELPSPSLVESIRNRTMGLYFQRYSLSEKTETAAIQDFMLSWKLRNHPLWPHYAGPMRRLTYWGPNYFLKAPVLSSAVRNDTARRLDRCAQAVREAANSTSYLSDESRFRGKANELLERLQEVKLLTNV